MSVRGSKKKDVLAKFLGIVSLVVLLLSIPISCTQIEGTGAIIPPLDEFFTSFTIFVIVSFGLALASFTINNSPQNTSAHFSYKLNSIILIVVAAGYAMNALTSLLS